MSRTDQLTRKGAGAGAFRGASRSKDRYVSDSGCGSGGCAGRGRCGGRAVDDPIVETVSSGLVAR